MKSLPEMLSAACKLLLRLLCARPQRRPACPHCGGGRCFGACQLEKSRSAARAQGQNGASGRECLAHPSGKGMRSVPKTGHDRPS